MRAPSTHLRASPRAFTLVEAAISIVIVGVMLTAALSMMGGAAQARRRTAAWREGEMLARSLICEVQQCGYGSTSGSLISITLGAASDRTGFDTVDDYKGFSESPPEARNGTLLSEYAGWRRVVEVERVDPADPSGPPRNTSTDTGLKRIMVTAVAPSGHRTTMYALRSRWGLVEASSNRPGAMLSGLTVSLRPGLGGKALMTCFTVPNHPGEGERVTVAADGSLQFAGGSGGEDGDGSGGVVGDVVDVLGDVLGGLLGTGGGKP